uniref:Uncharacterized protein LOC105128029 isoform X1 n=1 Tax=Rhizophora mucronata TaxID=61149 RepID=A0A2P2KY24_RHIMU
MMEVVFCTMLKAMVPLRPMFGTPSCASSPFPTYRTQTKTTAETTQSSIIPTFLRPANLQIQWKTLSFSLNILAGLVRVTV